MSPRTRMHRRRHGRPAATARRHAGARRLVVRAQSTARALWSARVPLALALALTAMVAPPVAAQPALESCTRFGDVVVARGEVLACNLNVVGGRLDVAAGGEVAGSVNVPFGDAHVAGVVGGDLYAGGDATVDGTVRGTAFTAGDLVVRGTVDGDVSANGDIDVSGRAAGDVESFAGGATIAGAVGGDVRVSGGLTLAESAVVGGGFQAGGEVRRAAGAQVLGPAAGSGTPGAFPRWASMAFKTLLVLSMVLFGALFTGLMATVAPGALATVRAALARHAGMSLAAGTLVVLLIVPVAVMLALPAVVMASLWVVMAPLLGVLGVVWLAAACFGAVALGTGVGAALAPGRAPATQAAVGGGAGALAAAAALMVGFRGWPVLCLVVGLGLLVLAWLSGAVWLTAFGNRRWPRTGAAPAGERAVQPVAPPPSAMGEPPAEMPAAGGPAAPADRAADAGGAAPRGSGPGDAASGASGPMAVPDDGTAAEAAGDAGVEDIGDQASTGVASDDPAGARVEVVDAAAAVAALRQVPGITPIYAQLLVDAGVDGLDALARSSPEHLAAAASVPGVVTVDPASVARWIDHAKRLSNRPA